MDLNTLAADIHQQNVEAGWWDEWPNKIDRVQTARCLVMTELAEAAEGARKDLMDDKLSEFKMFDVELADAAIRLLDLAGAYQIDVREYDQTIDRIECRHRQRRNKLEQISRVCERLYGTPFRLSWINDALFEIIGLASVHEIPLWLIIERKREFNATRADHKRENRAKEGGKKF